MTQELPLPEADRGSVRSAVRRYRDIIKWALLEWERRKFPLTCTERCEDGFQSSDKGVRNPPRWHIYLITLLVAGGLDHLLPFDVTPS